MTALDPVLVEGVRIARAVISGELDPMRGANAIWNLSSDYGNPYDDDFSPFIAAVSQWDEYPDSRALLVEDAMSAAEDLVAKYPWLPVDLPRRTEAK